ncbi:MAG: DUF3618 domain-containing protein [Desulfobacteraceae bacterium]|nr:DUF3618 domain-containing protein [Desulfobacteraceae bacterium]
MVTAGTESRRTPEEIERDLARTRAEMDDTMRAIEDKVTPGEWLDQALQYIAVSGYEYAKYLGRSIKRNPLPLALAGIGISWLVLAGGRESRTEILERRYQP